MYGGNGSTTFALPNLCGRVPVGTGTGSGLTNRLLGQASGAEAVTLTAAQLPAHTHPLLVTNQFGDIGLPAGAALASTEDPVNTGSTAPIYKKAAPDTALAPGSIGSAGGSQAHENMPPFLGLNYIICLEGMYPSHP